MSKQSSSPTYMFVFRSGLIKSDPSPEQMQAIFTKWKTWIDSMKEKGQYIAGDPLEERPAKVLREPHGGKVSDGPYAEAKEIVGGYMLIKAASFDEAVEIAKGAPSYSYGGCVEVRQLMPFGR